MRLAACKSIAKVTPGIPRHRQQEAGVVKPTPPKQEKRAAFLTKAKRLK
jgi:hypothetical protein